MSEFTSPPHFKSVPIPAETKPNIHSGVGLAVLAMEENEAEGRKSPTDEMMSPTSKRLFGPGKKKGLNKGPVKGLVKAEKKVFGQEYLSHSPVHRNYDLKSQLIHLKNPLAELDFIFGTSSEHRKKIIDELKWEYTQMSPDIDEKAIRSLDPLELPLLISKEKAKTLIETLQKQENPKPCLIMTTDQIVLFQREIREKPEHEQQAIDFLMSYNENSVTTVSAVSITHFPSLIQFSDIDIATLYWGKIDLNMAKRVVSRGVIYTCAGGFSIEDEDLNKIVLNIDGTIDSVMGLPVRLLVSLIEKVKGKL